MIKDETAAGETTVRNWGHSSAIRLPKKVIAAAGIAEGDVLSILATKGQLAMIVQKKTVERGTVIEHEGYFCVVTDPDQRQAVRVARVSSGVSALLNQSALRKSAKCIVYSEEPIIVDALSKRDLTDYYISSFMMAFGAGEDE